MRRLLWLARFVTRIPGIVFRALSPGRIARVLSPRQAIPRIRRAVKTAIRRWRRARLGKKRALSRQALALLGSLAVLLLAFSWSLSYLAPRPEGRQISVDELNALAEEGRIATTSFRDEDAHIAGSFHCIAPGAVIAQGTPPAWGGEPLQSKAGQPFTSNAPQCAGEMAPVAKVHGGHTQAEYIPRYTFRYPKTEAFWLPYPKSDTSTALLMQLAVDAGARVEVDPQTSKGQVRIVATIVLPLMILANLFALLFAAGKGASSGIGEVETFGSIGKGKLRRRKAPVTFAQVAGVDEAVEELKEVRDYLANPERYEQIGAMPPKGVLLVGPPGCGKTLLAKAVAGEVGVPFFSVAGAEFVESLVGVGAARVRDLFRRVRAAAPALVFIDELDAAGRKRASGGGSGGSDEREQTLNQMLVEMDGFEVSSGIVVIGATNRPDILDPALLRPGRFDRHVTIDRPDLMGRTAIMEIHARNRPVSPEVDLTFVARRTPGFSGADLANVVNEAALLAVRQSKTEIEMTDLEEAIQRVISGTAKRGRMLSPEERKRAAIHESGHVIVAAATGQFDEVQRVSIIARGKQAGSTAIRKKEEPAAVMTFGQLRGELITLMAGVASEELVFEEPSTGAEQDIEQATDLARDIVARYGMSEKLGRVRLLARDVDEFLDAEVPLGHVSGQTHYDVDTEVRRHIEDAEREAMRILTTHRETLDALAERLEEEETLEGSDLESVLTRVRPEVELFGGLVTASAGNGDGGHSKATAGEEA